jgi:hypothetical protein
MTDLVESAAGTALVVCRDAQTRQLIVESLRSLAVRPEICEEVVIAAALLDRKKFEAVIVDLLLGEGASHILDRLRLSRANRTAVTFAITTADERTRGTRPNSTFVLQRPLSTSSLNQILRAAYGLIVRERRRYFRCSIEVPAFVKGPQAEEFLCHTVNISEGGVAISTRSLPDSTIPASVRFNLPERSGELCAETKVCWRGQGDVVGLEFQNLASPQKAQLQEWLACKLDETLPENVVVMLRGVGQPSQ